MDESGNIKMRITIDVNSGKIEDVQRVDITKSIFDPGVTEAETLVFDSSKVDEKGDIHMDSLNVIRCHHTSILQTSNSPPCICFHQRGVGWRRVCF